MTGPSTGGAPSRGRRRPGWRRVTLLGSVVLGPVLLGPALLGLVPAAADAGAAAALTATAVGQNGGYFDLTLRSGASRQLAIAFGNPGAAPATARTYVADVYTIINGGFGARPAGAPRTGASRWIAYPASTVTVPAGRQDTRTFTVSVPAGTGPGEYISSVVLESNVGAAGTGQVGLRQVVRHAIAVAVRVPGPLRPALTIGAARYSVVAGHSVVDVAVRNTGNARLHPAGQLSLHNAAGRQVWRCTVTMDTFFPGTGTRVEVSLARLLPPGRYTVALTLADPAVHTSADSGTLTMAAVNPSTATSDATLPSAATPTAAPGPTVTATATATGRHLAAPADLPAGRSGPPAWALGTAAGGALLAATLALAARRRRQPRRTPRHAR